MKDGSRVTFYLPSSTVDKINKILTMSEHGKKSYIIIKAIDLLYDKIFKVTKEDRAVLDSIREVLNSSISDNLVKIKQIIQS